MAVKFKKKHFYFISNYSRRFHPMEALFPDFRSLASTHWKQPFHPSEGKYHPTASKVSSVASRNIIRCIAKHHPLVSKITSKRMGIYDVYDVLRGIFAKKTTFTATTATYCHLASPLNKGEVAEWQ